jgi:hypothetical protein
MLYWIRIFSRYQSKGRRADPYPQVYCRSASHLFNWVPYRLKYHKVLKSPESQEKWCKFFNILSKNLCFFKAAEWDTKPRPDSQIWTRQKSFKTWNANNSGSGRYPDPQIFWTKSYANRSRFGFLNPDSRIFMQTPDFHRICTIRYRSLPSDPIEPQTSCMWEGYNFKALVTQYTTSWIFVNNGIYVWVWSSWNTTFFPWTGTVWMVHNSNQSTLFGGDAGMPFECLQSMKAIK